MGFHDPFEYLKHKLWSIEGLKVKLSIWFLTTKSWESPWFIYVKVSFQITLKSSRRELQLSFKPHFNWRFAQKIMGLQSCKSPNFGNFGILNLGVSGQNDIWVLAPWPSIENTIMGKVMVILKSRPWWVLWVHLCPWFINASKVLQPCINQLVVWFVWIIHSLVTHLNPHLVAPTCPSTPEVLWAKNIPQLLLLFPLLDSHLNLSKNCGGALVVKHMNRSNWDEIPLLRLSWQQTIVDDC